MATAWHWKFLSPHFFVRANKFSWWRHRDWLGINACAAFVRCSPRSACKHLLIVERGFLSTCATENKKNTLRCLFLFLVEAQGLEPWTQWLKVICSTNWAMPPKLTFYQRSGAILPQIKTKIKKKLHFFIRVMFQLSATGIACGIKPIVYHWKRCFYISCDFFRGIVIFTFV